MLIICLVSFAFLFQSIRLEEHRNTVQQVPNEGHTIRGQEARNLELRGKVDKDQGQRGWILSKIETTFQLCDLF